MSANDSDGSVAAENLRAQLAANLAGLSDDDLHTLAVRSTEELEYRVGDALSNGLTEEQLAEFERLLDRDEDCRRWLENTLPTYKATVAIVCAKLIAEVTETVASADPAAVIGDRAFAEVRTASADLIEEHCGTRELKYSRTDDTTCLTFAAGEARPEVSSWLNLTDRDLLTVKGEAPEVSFPVEAQDTLSAFAAKWNCETWLPKAVIECGTECGTGSDWLRLTGEIANPLPPRVTRAHIDTLITDAVNAMFAFFEAVQKEALLHR